MKNRLYLFFTIAFFTLLSCNKNEKIKDTNSNDISYNYKTDSIWSKFTLREKIGQVVCYNYNKEEMMRVGNSSYEKFFEKYPVGSIFLANWSIASMTTPDSLSYLYQDLVLEMTKSSKTPLLISEDFESGLGSSMPNYTTLTTQMGLGATHSKKYAQMYSDIMSKECRSVGVNWVLNPVADLNFNPNNHLTNVRSIGDDPVNAINLISEQVKTMQFNGVAATAKHFPGDGTDYINQHFNTSQMKLSVDEWEENHGKVFQSLIDTDVMVIMTGHISFPAYQKEQLDGNYLPATLSDELVTKLLKKEMNFNGVVVSDALNMAGVTGYYENQIETEIECFKAGNDILLWPQLSFIDTLEARILRKEISEDRLDDAVNRVYNLKRKLGLLNKNYSPIQELSETDFVNHKESAVEIAQNAITVTNNKDNILSLDKEKVKDILLCVVAEGNQSNNFNPLVDELKKEGFNVDIQDNLPFFSVGYQGLADVKDKYDRIIFIFNSAPSNPWGSLALSGDEALTMWSANMLPFNKVISITFGDPYKNIIYMPRTWGRINCYSSDNVTQLVLAQGLVKGIEFKGKLPLKIN